jgi:hypothetical protein
MSGVATQVNISLGSVHTAGQVLTVLGLLLGLYIITPKLAKEVMNHFIVIQKIPDSTNMIF